MPELHFHNLLGIEQSPAPGASLTWTFAPNPENPLAFASLTARNAAGAVIAVVMVSTRDNGSAAVDVRATTGNPINAIVRDASGGIAYEGTA